MIADQLRAQSHAAAKDHDTVAKDILRLALGELQMFEARSGKAPTEDEAIVILKKLVKSNSETLAATTEPTAKATLEREIALLTALLPKTLGVDEIVKVLAPVEAQIREAKAEGQALGAAMKHLKTSGIANVQSADVAAAVKSIRTGGTGAG